MSKTTDRLRKAGFFGNLAANILQLLAAYPGVTVSAALGLLTAVFSGVLQLLQQPIVYIPAGVFLFLLWSYIGVGVLRKRKQIQLVKVQHDYAYSMICEGPWNVLFGKFPSNHPTDPHSDALNLQVQFRNVSTNALRVKVEEFRVVLDGRTCDDPGPIEIMFARLAPKGIKAAGVIRDVKKNSLTGTANIKLSYGPIDGDLVRTFICKNKIQIALDQAQQNGIITSDIVEERDIPYGER